jgi:hypothetical protein
MILSSRTVLRELEFETAAHKATNALLISEAESIIIASGIQVQAIKKIAFYWLMHAIVK